MTNITFILKVRSNNTISIPAKILLLCDFKNSQHFVQARTHMGRYEEDHIRYINNDYQQKRLAANKPISLTMCIGMPSRGQFVKLTILKEEQILLIEPSISSLIANN